MAKDFSLYVRTGPRGNCVSKVINIAVGSVLASDLWGPKSNPELGVLYEWSFIYSPVYV